MPEYYLVPKRAARAYPALGRAAQWLEGNLFRGLFWLVDRLSPESASAVAAAAFGLVGRHTDKARKVRKNLAVAFPEYSDPDLTQTTHEVFRQLGMAAAELIKMREIWEQRDLRIQFDIAPVAQLHLQAKKPAVFVTAHVGAWQLTNLISLHQDLTITTVYAAESNPTLHSVLLDLREAFGVKLLPSKAGVRPLLKELNAGNSIGLAMDTRLNSGEPIPFFGRDALTNTTAARLALRSGAALLPIRADRLQPGYYRITVYDPIVNTRPDADANEQAVAMTRCINAHFESWIRDAPEQWMCLKRRWPKPGKL